MHSELNGGVDYRFITSGLKIEKQKTDGCLKVNKSYGNSKAHTLR